MQTLYTLAYPRFSDEDRSFIEGFRREHDEAKAGVVAAHFTLVFGCADIPVQEYVAHVRAVAEATAAIRFVCRSAVLGADHDGPASHVFLVPDEGTAELSQLHARLYEGLLAPHLRRDLPYMPHITVGTTKDQRHATSLCEKLNAQAVELRGVVDAVVVCGYDGVKVTDLATLQLRS